MTTPHPQPKELQCPYARTLDEVGDFCIIKDDWVGIQDCGKCPARSRPHTPAAPDSKINPTESDARGYRCLHCEVRNDVRFCHYHGTNVISLEQHDTTTRNQTLDDVLTGAYHIASSNKRPAKYVVDVSHIESLRHQSTEARK